MLVVDLDNSLIKTDLLYETFLDGLAHRPFKTGAAVLGLARGRAALKARLADETEVDIAGLPYNEEVLAHIEKVRSGGGKVALVSASDRRLVEAVAAHLGCFDEAYGSDESHNLKGEAKAAFLIERYGEGGFDYVGDSSADLAVWKHARRAITVGASARLRLSAEKVAPEVHHLARRPSGFQKWKPYVKALRPHQWMKNVLIFVPAMAAHSAAPETWLTALLAFIAFSLTASSVYVLNDLLDLSADRAHPRKKERPFAAGRIPVTHGGVMAAALLAVSFGLAIGLAPPLFVGVLAFYYAVTFAYSFVLKRRLVIDICTLAGLYTIRVIAGSAATDITPSPWLLALSVFLFLSLAAMKRQTDLVDQLKAGRTTSGRAYRIEDLPIVASMAIAAGYISVMVLALYINSPEVRELYQSPFLLWGACPILLYWTSRLVMLAHRGRMLDDPVVFAVRDKVSLACGAAILLIGVAAATLDL